MTLFSKSFLKTSQKKRKKVNKRINPLRKRNHLDQTAVILQITQVKVAAVMQVRMKRKKIIYMILQDLKI